MSDTTDTTTSPAIDPVTDPVPVPEPATDLGDLVEAMKREVALPGGFSTAYPDISDDNLVDYLGDAFSECQLDGWFGVNTLHLDDMSITPPISPPAQALVVIYGGMRWVRIELRTLKTNARYKAGPVEYETSQTASLLTQLLKDLTARRDALVASAKTGRGASYVLDAVWGREARQLEAHFAPLELPYRGGNW